MKTFNNHKFFGITLIIKNVTRLQITSIKLSKHVNQI